MVAIPMDHASDTQMYGVPSESEVRAEMNRILASALFSQSDRLGRFLRFAIDYALSGRGDGLKEYLIGTEVYDRKPPYHPSSDSIVRTEARRLRMKLKEYYETEGKDSRVFIYFRPGTYSPLFHRNSAERAAAPIVADPAGKLLVQGSGVALAVLPFSDLSKTPLSAQCANGITDELIHAITLTDGLRTVSHAAVEQATAGAWDVSSLCQKLSVSNVIEGTVREEGGRLRVNFRVLNADGFQSSSHRFETVAESSSIAWVQEQIVSAFVSRARPLQSSIRKRKAGAGGLTLAVYPLVIHAETMLDEGTSADIQSALNKFQESIQMAPGFARSYCGVAQCNLELALRGAVPSAELIQRAYQSALKAIDLDAEMFGCYGTLASCQALSWDWKAAEANYIRAVNLGVHALTSRQYALFLAAIGKFEEGAEHLDIAQKIDPFSYRQKVSRVKFLHLTRRFEQALSQPDEPTVFGAVPLEWKLYLALMAAQTGDRQRAMRIVDLVRSKSYPFTALLVALSEIMAWAGDKDASVRLVERYRLLSAEIRITSYRKALLALALGNEEQCLALLGEALLANEAELVWLGTDPRFDSLREETAFAEILAQVFQPDKTECGSCANQPRRNSL